MVLLRRNRYKTIAVALCLISAAAACTKVWDDHNKITDPNLKNNLYQAISANPGLSKFSQYLAKTGYDKIISSSKTYTVWAPSDQALQTLDPAIVNDTAKLKLFVGNHISNQSYTEGAGVPSQRVQMLNGKYNNITGSNFDSANIVTANQYANNGVFHIIDKFIPWYYNCWQFLQNSTVAPAMKSYLLSLDTMKQDFPVQIGVDPLTGQPVYQPGVGYVKHNLFLDSIVNVNDEAGQYTFILLTDGSFSTELNKITPYFKTGSPDTTAKLGSFHLVKDLAYKGLYTPAQLPDTLISQFGVKTPMTKAAIAATYKTSNGIVYVMNGVNFTFANKFLPFVIQGETPNGFAADRSNNTFYRVRTNPLTGLVFNDIYLQNYNSASYWIYYRVRNVYSTRYNASWVAVNDVQTTPLWQQRLGVDSVNNTTNLPYVTVAYQNYAEVALGQLNITSYRTVNLFVIGPAAASSTGGANSISLDYIKLTPLP